MARMESSETVERASDPWRAADVLARGLVALGVRHVFGMPGSHTTTVYDALSLCPGIETILIRNEQAAAFAADGYSRVTGAPGVVCTTAGPGATNALTGVAEAWSDGVPILLLAGQVNADRMDVECGAYHEIDLLALCRPVTKFAANVRAPDEIGTLLDQAFTAMRTGRRRPAALILPQDVMRAEVQALPGHHHSVVGGTGSPGPVLDKSRPARAGSGEPVALESRPSVPMDERPTNFALLEKAARILCEAERPIILAGGGAEGLGRQVRELAIRLNAPVVTSLNGKGIISEFERPSLGHARSARAKVALPHADAMLAIGCRFTEVMTEWRRMPVPANLVQIDIDPDSIGTNHRVAVGIVSDAEPAIDALLRLIPERYRDGWEGIREKAHDARPASPEWLIEVLQETLPPETPAFADACEIGYRMHTDYRVRGPWLFFYPSNYITLGWGFPAAIGAAVALGPARHVVSVSGDGGFVMTAQELATVARYNLNVIAIVHNDSTYGAIKNIQKRAHHGRYRDVELNNPDFLKLADAYGVPAVRVGDPESFRLALQTALRRSGPSLIEVPDEWRSIRE
jgi:acetolactate synthase I/II/III large subunit